MWAVKNEQSVAEFVIMMVKNVVKPKAAAMHELWLNRPVSDLYATKTILFVK
jgi:hypothetical protein